MRIIFLICTIWYCLLYKINVNAQTNQHHPPSQQTSWDYNSGGQTWNHPPPNRNSHQSAPNWNNGPPPPDPWNQQPPPSHTPPNWNNPPPNKQWNGPPPQSNPDWNNPPPSHTNWGPPNHHPTHPHSNHPHQSHQNPPHSPHHPPPSYQHYPPNYQPPPNHPPPSHSHHHNAPNHRPHQHHHHQTDPHSHHQGDPHPHPPYQHPPPHQPHRNSQHPPPHPQPWNNQPPGQQNWNHPPDHHQGNTPPPQQPWNAPTTPLYPEWNLQTQSPWGPQNQQSWSDPNQNPSSGTWSGSPPQNNHHPPDTRWQNSQSSTWHNPNSPQHRRGPPPHNQWDHQPSAPPYPHTPPPYNPPPPYPYTPAPYPRVPPAHPPYPPKDNWQGRSQANQYPPPPPPPWQQHPPPHQRHPGDWGHQKPHSRPSHKPHNKPPNSYDQSSNSTPHRNDNQWDQHQQYLPESTTPDPYLQQTNSSVSMNDSYITTEPTTVSLSTTSPTPATFIHSQLGPVAEKPPRQGGSQLTQGLSAFGTPPKMGSLSGSNLAYENIVKGINYSTNQNSNLNKNPPYTIVKGISGDQMYGNKSNTLQSTTAYPYFPWDRMNNRNNKGTSTPNQTMNKYPPMGPNASNRGPPYYNNQIQNQRQNGNPRSQGHLFPPPKKIWPNFGKPLHHAPWMNNNQVKHKITMQPTNNWKKPPQVAPAVQSGPPNPNAGPGPHVVPAEQGKKLAEPLITPSYMNYGVNHPDGLSTTEEFQLIASRVQRLISFSSSMLLTISDYLTMDRNRQTFALRSRGIRDMCYVGILDQDIISAFREVVNKTKAVQFPFIEANAKLFFYKELEQILYSDALREAGQFVADSCGKDAFIFRVVRVNHGVIQDGNKTIPGDACPFGPPLRDNPWSVTQCSNKLCPIEYKCNHMYNVCCPDMPATTNCVSLSLGQICITYLPTRVIID